MAGHKYIHTCIYLLFSNPGSSCTHTSQCMGLPLAWGPMQPSVRPCSGAAGSCWRLLTERVGVVGPHGGVRSRRACHKSIVLPWVANTHCTSRGDEKRVSFFFPDSPPRIETEFVDFRCPRVARWTSEGWAVSSPTLFRLTNLFFRAGVAHKPAHNHGRTRPVDCTQPLRITSSVNGGVIYCRRRKWPYIFSPFVSVGLGRKLYPTAPRPGPLFLFSHTLRVT